MYHRKRVCPYNCNIKNLSTAVFSPLSIWDSIIYYGIRVHKISDIQKTSVIIGSTGPTRKHKVVDSERWSVQKHPQLNIYLFAKNIYLLAHWPDSDGPLPVQWSHLAPSHLKKKNHKIHQYNQKCFHMHWAGL